MELADFFLKSNSTNITFSGLEGITTQQSDTKRLEDSIANKLGRIIDEGLINIGCYLNA